MASPSSSSPSPPQEKETNNKSPMTNSPKSTTPSIKNKKPQPLPWTHQETINLIQSYQDKWYSLKKGQLKSSQWEQVSLTLASLCAFNQPSKTSTQCRHKIEKLRKRYRAERLKPYPHSWPYFVLMDCMETGPLSITMAPPMPVAQCDNDSDDSDLDYSLNKSRSINHIVKGSSGANVERNVRAFGVSRKRKDFYEIDDEDEEDEEVDDQGEEEEGEQGTRIVTELAGQITTFAENFVKVEQKKVQMMREMAKYQLEMENKRMKMIIESQKKIVETIHEAFSTSQDKMKTAP